MARRQDCPVCVAFDLIDARIVAEGCERRDFDPVEVIASRLQVQGVRLDQVRSGDVPSDVFWRAVYGPAYPALVTA